jgi:hypothetical protein
MPRTSKAEARVAMDNEVLTSRHVELDDVSVVFETYHMTASTEVIEFSPTDKLAETLAVLAVNMAATGAPA